MTGVTWRPLPADAPEPPPLSLVREGGVGQRCWVRTPTGWWRVNGNSSHPARWRDIREGEHSVELAEDTDAYAPWPAPPGEVLTVEHVEPSEFDIREAALDAAARYVAGYSDPDHVVEVARSFETYLRGDPTDPELTTAENTLLDPGED